MNQGQLILPTDEKEFCDVTNRLIDAAKMVRAPHAVEWYINYHYLRGARTFDEIDFASGSVTAFYEDMYGDLPFKYEDILGKYNSEVGRLMRLDIRPFVDRQSIGLQYARKAAVAFVTLDTLMRGQNLDAIKLQVIQSLVLYGTIALTNWVVQEPGTGDMEGDPLLQESSDVHVISVVPPWELIPLPGTAMSEHSYQGIVRERWVAYDWLNTLSVGEGSGLKLPPVTDERLEAREAQPGSLVADDSPVMGSDTLPTPAKDPPPPEPSRGGDGFRQGGKKDDRLINYVRLREFWMPTASGRLARYSVTAGNALLYDKNYEEKAREARSSAALPVMPISVATYTGGVGFFGRSFVGPLVTVNAEVEDMLLSLFRNVQDLDQFGYLFYPDTWGIPRDAVENAQANRRVFEYTPDPVNPNMGVHGFSPTSAGDFPARVAEQSLGLLDRLSQQPQQLLSGDAPGRTESGKSLDLLYQTSTIPLGGPSLSLADAFATVYKSVLWNTKASWTNLQVNLMSLLDESVIGIKFDPKSGNMSFNENSLPDPSEVIITIRSKEPVSDEQKKSEIMAMLQQGIITRREFRLMNRRDVIGLPTGNDVEWNNYVRATINNILMFGDGETPGKAFISDFDIPSIHEYVVTRLIARPEFSLASEAVQRKFIDRVKDLRAKRGMLPNQAPYIEDSAEQAAFIAQMQQEGMADMGEQAPTAAPVAPGEQGAPGLSPDLVAAAGPQAPEDVDMSEIIAQLGSE